MKWPICRHQYGKARSSLINHDYFYFIIKAPIMLHSRRDMSKRCHLTPSGAAHHARNPAAARVTSHKRRTNSTTPPSPLADANCTSPTCRASPVADIRLYRLPAGVTHRFADWRQCFYIICAERALERLAHDLLHDAALTTRLMRWYRGIGEVAEQCAALTAYSRRRLMWPNPAMRLNNAAART